MKIFEEPKIVAFLLRTEAVANDDPAGGNVSGEDDGNTDF